MARRSSSHSSPRTVALGYIRKSWTRDEKDNISPERQRSHIQAICDLRGWQAEWYEDTEGHRSGMHEKNRPGWRLNHGWMIETWLRSLQTICRGCIVKAGELATS
jgi:hypothetical protein